MKNVTGLKRMFINSDGINSDEVNDTLRCICYCFPLVDRPELKFDFVIGDAAYKIEDAMNAIKECDEIYASTRLIGLMGGYFGAPQVFDGLMDWAIKNKVERKSLFITKAFEKVDWGAIDIKRLKKCFAEKKNKLYVLSTHNSDYPYFKYIQVNKTRF